MRVGPMLKWFGSKWSATKRGNYPDPLPGLPIFEPYAGGAGYSLNHCDHPVVIWEDDPHLSELWQWLITEATSELVMAIPVGVPEGTPIQDLRLSKGQALLLKHWQRTNNVGNCWTVSKWGHLPGQWNVHTQERVAREVECIKHWKFLPIDYTRRGTYYFDPPYQYNYRYRFKEAFDYLQMVSNISLISKGSRVIVCEAICPKTGAIPTYLPFSASHQQVTSRRKQSQNHHSKELIWVKNT